MKKRKRKECGNFTNVKYENKRMSLKEVPDGECFAYMTKEKKARVEKEIKKRVGFIK